MSKKEILDWIDDVNDMIKVMKRLILEKLFDNLFTKGRREVAPKLSAINSKIKGFGALVGINLLLTEFLEKVV